MYSSCSPVRSRPAQHGLGAAAAHHSKPGSPAAAGPAQTAQASRPGGAWAAAALGLHAPQDSNLAAVQQQQQQRFQQLKVHPAPTLPVTQQLWSAGVCHPQGLLQSAKPSCCCIDTSASTCLLTVLSADSLLSSPSRHHHEPSRAISPLR